MDSTLRSRTPTPTAEASSSRLTARGASTRERILEAAVDVFASKGYYDATVDDIVRASNTSKGSFYHFFPNKEGIFLKLIDVLTGRLVSKVEAAIAREQGALRQLEAALEAVVHVFAEHRRLAKIFLIEAAGLGHGTNRKLVEVRAQLARLIQGHLERAVQEGAIPPLDTHLASYVWVGAITEVVVQWLYTGQPDPGAALPRLRRMFLQSVGAGQDAGGAAGQERGPEGRGPEGETK